MPTNVTMVLNDAASVPMMTLSANNLLRKIIIILMTVQIGFGGLGVACWPLVPKFAGSNPAEAVGFLGRKNPQYAFLQKGSKAVGCMS